MVCGLMNRSPQTRHIPGTQVDAAVTGKRSGRSVGKCRSRVTPAPDRESCSNSAYGAERTNANETLGNERLGAEGRGRARHNAWRAPIAMPRLAASAAAKHPKVPQIPTRTISRARSGVWRISCQRHKKVGDRHFGDTGKTRCLREDDPPFATEVLTGKISNPQKRRSDHCDNATHRRRRYAVLSMFDEKPDRQASTTTTSRGYGSALSRGRRSGFIFLNFTLLPSACRVAM